MKHVLVTGGAGFIGSHLSQALINKGYQVRIIDNLVYGKKEWLPVEAEFIKGDISDLETCHEAMTGINGVFHCAAMSRAGPSLDNIDVCTRSNIVGTQNILLAAREANVKKIIYSGSSTYYGNHLPPHREYETPGQFLNFYALSKQVGENYCLLFDEVFNLPCVILRYFNVYGPRQPEVGEYALVLGIFLRRLANQEALQIHGDGQQRRDFIHVNDVVSANIAAYESHVRYEIFNVGSGNNVSIKELANLISPNQVHIDRRPGDAEVTLADISRIREKLNWHPKMPLIQGIQELKETSNQAHSVFI
jgi:nucleoside-diphosphate-sugar epimerase